MNCGLMFDQANSFYICDGLCEKELKKRPKRHDLYSTPQIVNLALACEIYLKTLLVFRDAKIGKKHKLNELFDSLPESDKNIIDRETFRRYPFPSPFRQRKIDVEANAFVQWRYSYEKYRISCDVGYLEALAKTLQEYSCKTIFNLTWEQYCQRSYITDFYGDEQ